MKSPNPMMWVFTRNLAALRLQKNLTKAQVAEKLNMSYRKYYRLEKGRLDIDLSTTSRIAALYQVPIATLMIHPLFKYKVCSSLKAPYQAALDRLTKLDKQIIEKVTEYEHLLLQYHKLDQQYLERQSALFIDEYNAEN